MSIKLLKPPAVVPVEDSLTKLAPEFVVRLNAVMSYMTDKGHSPRIFETFRTNARQQYLYRLGRTYAGKIVTYARSAQDSWHGYGLAADIIDRKRGWDASVQFWFALRDACKWHNLTWGGDWNGNGIKDETFYDLPHVQFSNCPRSPKPSDAQLFALKGASAVWSFYNAN